MVRYSGRTSRFWIGILLYIREEEEKKRELEAAKQKIEDYNKEVNGMIEENEKISREMDLHGRHCKISEEHGVSSDQTAETDIILD